MTYPYALTFDRYRELLDQDYQRTRDIAGTALDADIPGCPGWNGEHLLRHTALVYLQKAETIRTGTKPGKGWVTDELKRMDPLVLLQKCHDRLMEQFDAHQPDDPSETWVKDDQTVGFWIRRLTHETAIHRYDLEAAVNRTTPIDSELAVDGIDEVLTVMLCRSPPDDAASGSTVTLRSAGLAWTLNLGRETVALERQVNDSATSVVAGRAEDVLLWLWGRGPLPEGSADSPAAAELRERLASAT